MSRYEEMFALVGQLGAQLREGYAAGQAALGPVRGERRRLGDRSARWAARPSAAAWPRRSGATRCALPVSREPRGRAARAGSGRAISCVPVSYSGATAETLAAARAALERGAGVIAVTAGEPLGALVERRGRPGRARPRGPAAARGAGLALRRAGGRARARGRGAAGRRSDIRAAAHACDAVAARSRRQPRERARRGRRDDRRRGSTATARSRPSPGASRASSTRTRSPSRPSASCPRPTTTRSSAGPGRRARAAAMRPSTWPTPTIRRPSAPASPRRPA